MYLTTLEISITTTDILIIIFPVLGLCFAAFYYLISLIVIDPSKLHASPALLQQEDGFDEKEQSSKLYEIYMAIYQGAHSFLYQEYLYMAGFIVLFSGVIIVVIGFTNSWFNAIFTALAFIAGALTSILAGFIGMRIGVYANARTAVQAQQKGLNAAFVTSFRAGIVMGFVLCSLGVLVLFAVISLFGLHYSMADPNQWFEAVAGFGLGGSSIGLFGRVGGGIYTKAADVGADLVGKVEAGIPEDDPRNPAVIADNVGDNVGDIAGMGADLFGSFAEATCAALVIAAQSEGLSQDLSALLFPLMISAVGIPVGIITSFVATNFIPATTLSQIEPSLKRQLIISTIVVTPVLFLISWLILPQEFNIARRGSATAHFVTN